MKQVIFFLFLLFSRSVNSQQEPLHYFINKDSLLGVKDSKGKVIIPAKHLLIFDIKNGDKVEKGFINLIEINDTSAATKGSFGKMYNRKGEFLYRPYMFDNGPDYEQEGIMRFVENHKIGFVDRHATKVIPAKFDFVSSFSLGTAVFCTDCYFDRSKDSEHPPLVGGTYGMIDKSGNVLVDGIPFRSTNKVFDSIKQKIYVQESQYTVYEKRLISKIDPYKSSIEKEYYANLTSSYEKRSLVFDIVEKPSKDFSYYVINSRENIDGKIYDGSWDTLQFYVTKDGKSIYFNDSNRLIPFLKWFRIYSKGGRNYD